VLRWHENLLLDFAFVDLFNRASAGEIPAQTGILPLSGSCSNTCGRRFADVRNEPISEWG
jgi:hypothetical protein